MTNLVQLNLSGCTLITSIDFVKCTPSLEKLNVSSCPSMSTFSLISNLNRLTKLKVFTHENNNLRVSAHSIYQCVHNLTSLQYLSSKESEVMRPWICRLIMAECPNLHTFYFTTLFSMDTEKHKYEWYHLVRISNPHVTFTTRVLNKVVEYKGSCEHIKAMEKKIHPIARHMV